MSELFSFEGYDIPVRLINMTGSGTDLFAAIGNSMLADLKTYVWLQPDHKVVEIGCGVGRCAIPLSSYLTDRGSYLGIDIIGPSIDFCSQNITPRHPQFRFVHYDVKDQLHNPTGVTTTQNIIIPVGDQSVDRIVLWSVFTHLLRPEIVHYLKEFRRILKPDGLVFFSCFVVSPEVLASARATDLTPYALRFEHEIEPGCYINDVQHPLGAVAYELPLLNKMVAAADLSWDRPFDRGGWSGLIKSSHGQDYVVLKPRASWLRRLFG